MTDEECVYTYVGWTLLNEEMFHKKTKWGQSLGPLVQRGWIYFQPPIYLFLNLFLNLTFKKHLIYNIFNNSNF